MYHINKLIEGSGEYVNLKDTAEYRFKKLQIKGNSTQETRSGKNICPTDFDAWESGQYGMTGGKEDATARIRLKELLPVKPSKTYYFKVFVTTTITTAFAIRTYDVNGNFVRSVGGVSNGGVLTTSDTEYYLGVTMYSGGSNFEQYQTNFESGVISPFICLNTETDKTFEEYGISPSPEFPSEIETVGDDINLFDKDNRNEIIGYFHGSATTIWSISTRRIIYIPCEPNETYTVQILEKFTQVNMFCVGYTTELPAIGVTVNGIIYDIKSKKTITVGNDAKYLVCAFNIEKYTLSYEEVLAGLKIEKGSIATLYSPYGMGSVEINVSNKNLLKLNPRNGTISGVKSVVENGKLKLQGTSTANTGFVLADIGNINAFLGQTLTYTLKTTGTITGETYSYIELNCRSISNNWYWQLRGETNKSRTHTKKLSQELTSLYVYIPSGVTLNCEIEVQIEKNDTSTEIIEHQSQSLPIYLDREYCKIGDYQDYLYKDLDEGKWYKHKEINKFKITSNLNLLTANIGTNSYSINLGNAFQETSKVCVLSNYFYGVSNDDRAMKIKNKIYFDQFNNLIIRDTDITTLDELKTFLDNNDVYIYYILATPIEEEITNPILIEQYDKLLKLQAFKGETNVYNTGIAILDVAAYKQITDEFIENIINGKPTRGYIKVLANNQYPEIIINENNYLKDFKIEDLRYIPEEGFIGGAVCKRVTGNFNNVDNNFTIQDREFELYLGVDFEDGSTEYIKYGTFIVQKPSDDRVTDNTYFEALDYMCKFNQPYVDRITYPCTLKDLFYDVVSQATLETTVDSFANDDFIVENNQFESGATLRDVLKAIAQIAFTWARVDEENYVQLDFEQKEEISEELDENQYYNLETSKEYGPVNTIVIRNSQIEGENVTIKNQKLIDAPSGNQLVDFGNAQTTDTADYTWENNVLTVDSTNKADKTYNLIGYNVLDLVLNNRGKTLYFKVTSLDLSEYTSTNDAIVTSAIVVDGKKSYTTLLNKKNATRGCKIPETGEITSASIGVLCNNTSTTGTPSIVKVIEPMLSFVENATYEPYIKTGPVELVINDNPFAYTQEKRQQLITAGEKMYGLTYTPMKMNMIGMFYLNSKDKIRVKTLNNQYYETYLLDHTIDYTGTVSDNMEAQAKTKTETQYKYTPPLEQQLKHTEVKVDKANQKIQAIIENQTSTNTQVTELNLELGKISASVATKDEVTNQINELQINVENTINKVTTSGGNNIFYTAKEYWHGETEESSASLEVITDTDIKQNTTSGLAYDLNNGVSIQKQTVKNDAYTISFIYNKKLASSTAYVLINNERYDLITSTVNKWNNFVAQVNIDTNSIEIEFVCDSNNGFYVADLMVNIGSEKMVWSQNANETITDTVIIGRGIQVNSSNTKTYTRMDADGNRTFNSLTNERVGEMTSKGIYGNELEVKGQAKVNALLIQKVDNQVWLTGL